MKSFPHPLPAWLAGFLFFSALPLYAQNLSVENVRFQQGQNSRVIVYYDLIGEPTQKYQVNLSIFLPEFQKTVPLENSNALRLDIGKNVQPGRGKRIVWDLLEDFPKGLNGDGYVFVVDAYVQKSGKMRWIIGGVAAAGGGAALLLLNGGDNGGNTLPGAPKPPSL